MIFSNNIIKLIFKFVFTAFQCVSYETTFLCSAYKTLNIKMLDVISDYVSKLLNKDHIHREWITKYYDYAYITQAVTHTVFWKHIHFKLLFPIINSILNYVKFNHITYLSLESRIHYKNQNRTHVNHWIKKKKFTTNSHSTNWKVEKWSINSYHSNTKSSLYSEHFILGLQ